jgi:hypothetical protein
MALLFLIFSFKLQNIEWRLFEKNIWTYKRGRFLKSNTEELHNLFSLPNIVIVFKLRRIRWIGHEVCMGKL